MELALNEVKIQAKILLKTLTNDSAVFDSFQPILARAGVEHSADLKLKHCLSFISAQLGFRSWQQAIAVLTGKAQSGNTQNMGTLFYPNGVHGITNEWFASYDEAKAMITTEPNKRWLFPYKNQYIVVKQDYIAAFKFTDESKQLLASVGGDMAASYNTIVWDKVCLAIIKNRAKGY